MFSTSFIIAKTEAEKRIDTLCAEKFPDFSRSRWQKTGTFVCEGVTKTGKTKTQSRESWEVSCEKAPPLSDFLTPWDTPLKILKETDSWMAVEKSAGISVHPSQTEGSKHTIVNALLHHSPDYAKYAREYLKLLSTETEFRPGIVHRLDKVTSGVLLIAKTETARTFFQSHWKEVEKTYYAVVPGHPPPKGKIEAGIGRDASRTKMTVSGAEKAKSAVTFFENEASDENFSLLKTRIPTGRTHQIRVHLSSIGFPILGDEMYGGGKAERVFLHAYALEFPDPDIREKRNQIISEMPRIFLSRVS